MKDGTVVNERAAFKGYINNGGGYVAMHAANDSMHTWSENGSLWYQALLGGLFVSAPGQPERLRTDCGSCYWSRGQQRGPDASVDWTARAVPTSWRSATSCTTSNASRASSTTAAEDANEARTSARSGVGANASNTEGGDHRSSWCSNYDGGREWSQVLGHNWRALPATPGSARASTRASSPAGT
jgi:hypothetical protein